MLGIYLLALIVAAFVAKVLLCPTRIHVYKKDAAKASRSLRGGSALSGLARVALLIAFSGFAQCQFAPNWDIQPTQAVLEWVPTEDCPTLLDYLAADLGTTVQRPTAEQYERITGGCAILTFCNRDGGDYNDGLYGYKMGAPNDATADCLSPGPMIPVEAGHTYALSKFDVHYYSSYKSYMYSVILLDSVQFFVLSQIRETTTLEATFTLTARISQEMVIPMMSPVR